MWCTLMCENSLRKESLVKLMVRSIYLQNHPQSSCESEKMDSVVISIVCQYQHIMAQYVSFFG